MEATKKYRKKTPEQNSDALITEAYKTHLLTEGEKPKSVYRFCIDNQITETDFYNHFGSFEAIDRSLWKGFAHRTIEGLQSDTAFAEFSARDKILTFYFALAETLKMNRSYILLSMHQHKRPERLPDFLKDFKISFELFTSQVINDGIAKSEIAKRPLLDKRYPQLFWVHMSFFLLYWKSDSSKAFERTDVFIEKTVNLAFDLIGKGAIDSAIDFLKFLYQQKS
jgi:AcrR family transcriptional regulator